MVNTSNRSLTKYWVTDTQSAFLLEMMPMMLWRDWMDLRLTKSGLMKFLTRAELMGMTVGEVAALA